MHRGLRWLALVALLAPAAPARPAEPGAVPCGGCNGSGASTSSSGGLCEGMIEITVLSERGQCDWLWSASAQRVECRMRRGCTPVITRVWRDLPPEIEIDHGVEIDGRELSLVPRPSSGLGWGRTVRRSPTLPCRTDDPGLVFSASNASCNLHAKVITRCLGCKGRA